MPRKYTLKERKLGREKASGIAHLDEGLIEIDPRQPPREWLATLVHEALHHAFPRMGEAAILGAEKKIIKILWDAGIRRTHQ